MEEFINQIQFDLKNDLQHNKKYYVIGHTNSGKSSFLSCLLKKYEKYSNQLQKVN